MCHLVCRYSDTTSQWTLDYPPLFAWFEWLLSQAAAYVDPGIVQLTNLEYASQACIIFQVTMPLQHCWCTKPGCK